MFILAMEEPFDTIYSHRTFSFIKTILQMYCPFGWNLKSKLISRDLIRTVKMSISLKSLSPQITFSCRPTFMWKLLRHMGTLGSSEWLKIVILTSTTYEDSMQIFDLIFSKILWVRGLFRKFKGVLYKIFGIRWIMYLAHVS